MAGSEGIDIVESLSRSNSRPKIATSIMLGFFVALLAIGLPMIGVTVNLYLGAVMLISAFGCFVYGIWQCDKVEGFSNRKKLAILAAVAFCYFGLAAWQMRSQYKKDHAQTASIDAYSIKALTPHSTKETASGRELTNSTQAKLAPPTTVRAARRTRPSDRRLPDTTAPVQQAAPPTYKQDCVGSACAQGPDSQAVFNQYGAPSLAMSDAQRDVIRDGMKPYAGKKVAIYCQSTQDAISFADQLVVAMQEAGLTAEKSCALMLAEDGGKAPLPGVSMDITQDRFDLAVAFGRAMWDAKLVNKPIPVTRRKQDEPLFAINITPNR